MAHQYLNENLKKEDFKAGNTVSFDGEEAHHAVRVSRLRVGEQTRISNGYGSWAIAEVTETTPQKVVTVLQECFYDPPESPRLILIQALAKSDRTERALEQATEFGIDEVLGWQAARSIVRWDENKQQKNLLKWEKITREAAKQSLRTYLPKCGFIFTKNIQMLAKKPENNLFILHPAATEKLSIKIKDTANEKSVKNFYFIVGPEGGLTATELKDLESSGAIPVRLGSNVLRTSSAGVAAISVAKTVLKQW